MKFVIKSAILLLGLMSTLSFSQETQDCLSIQNTYVSLIESGKYRFANKNTSKTPVSINFNELTSYQEYIEKAYSLVVNKNPKATMPCPIVTDTYQQLSILNNWPNLKRNPSPILPENV